MGKKVVRQFRALFIIAIAIMVLQTVAADALSGQWLLLSANTVQASPRQFARLRIKASPVASQGYIGETIEVDVSVTNTGNMAAQDVTIELEGGMTLLATPQQRSILNPGEQIAAKFQAQIIGWEKGTQNAYLRTSSPSLPYAMYTKTNIVFTPNQTILGERIRFVDNPNRAVPAEIEGEWQYRGGTGYYPRLRFTLRNGVQPGEVLQINLTSLVTTEQMSQGYLTLEIYQDNTIPTLVNAQYDSTSHALIFTSSGAGLYTMRFKLNEGQQTLQRLAPETDPDMPVGWVPTFHEPTVAQFSGATTYNYPLLIPPGAAGFQPNLSLNYHSGGSNGIIDHYAQSDPFGWGWQLDGLMEVSQAVKFCNWNTKICPKNAYWGSDDHAHPGTIEFTLNIGGTGYELTHEDGVASNGYTGRYFLKGNSSIYVAYCGAPSPGLSAVPWACSDVDTDDGTVDGFASEVGHQTHTYWVVVTPENATYRLGYRAMSEQELFGDRGDGFLLETGEEMGSWNTGYGHALRWRVDKASDRFDNTIVYSYTEHDLPNSKLHTNPSYINQIDYGNNKITFHRAYRDGALGGIPPNDNPAPISWQVEYFDRIVIEAGSSSSNMGVVRSYELRWDWQKYGKQGTNGAPYPGVEQSAVCASQDTENYEGWKAGLLAGITELDKNGQNILGESDVWDGQGNLIGGATSTVSFGYIFLKTGDFDNSYPDIRCHPYMGKVFTIYGPPPSGGVANPTVTFDYDDAIAVKYNISTVTDNRVNPVKDKTVFDGMGASYQTTYTYDSADAHHVIYSVYPDSNGVEIFSGFQKVVSTVKENGVTHHSQTTVFAKQEKYGANQTYNDDWPLNGRILSVEIPGWQKATNTWGLHPVPNTQIVVLNQTQHQDFRGTGTTTTTIYSGYDAYGNPATVTENSPNAQRVTTTQYVQNINPAAGYWLVGLPWEVTTTIDGELASKMQYRYDGAGCGNPAGQVPTLGLVTAIDTYNNPAELGGGVPNPYYPPYSGGECSDAAWLTVHQGYGGAGGGSGQAWQLTSTTTPSGKITTSQWNSSNPVLLDSTTASGETTSFGYNASLPWLVSNVTYPDGNTSSYEYDSFGRLETSTTPSAAAGLPTTFVYNDTTSPLTIDMVQGGVTTTTTYDGIGRATTQAISGLHSSLGTIYTTMAYNVLGKVGCQSEPLNAPTTCHSLSQGEKTTFDYDVLGELGTTTDPDGNTTVRTPLSSVAWSVKDRKNQTTVYTYDGLGRLRAVAPPEGGATTYTYTRGDNLYQVIPPGDSSTTITMYYDMLGRKIKMEDPDMGTWLYQYDLDGNLRRQVDNAGQTLCFYYDNLNRLTDKTKPAGDCANDTPASGEPSLAHYTYYSSGSYRGLVQTITGGTGEGEFTDSFTYDGRDRLVSQTRQVGAHTPFVMGYSNYDALDRPGTMTYPDGSDQVTMSYDGQMAAGLSSTQAGTLVSNVLYNNRLQNEGFALGNGVAVDYGYHGADELFRLETLTYIGANGPLLDYTYSTYDNLGNIETLTSQVAGEAAADFQQFTYDALNRLDAASGSEPGYALAYTYDDIGNITSITGTDPLGTVNKSFDYTGDNKPHAVNSVGSDSFSYDANGNMEFRVDASGSYSQTFDVENRLVSVVNQNTGAETEFYYDADGIRILTIQCTGACDTNYSNEVSRTYTPFPDYEEQVNREAIQIVGPTPTPSAPVAPTNLDAVEISNGAQTAVYLTWTYSGDSNGVTYNVYRSSYNFASDNGELIAIGLTAPTYSDISGDLSIHRYRVTAVSTVGESDPSNIVPAGCTGTCPPETNYLFGKIRSNARRLSAPVQQTASTLNPVQDSHISSSSPTSTSGGSASTIRNRAGSPEYRVYLQFDLSSLSGSVQQATLRLYVTDGSNDGGSVYAVSNNYNSGSGPWTEAGLTYNNAPALGATPLDSLGAVSNGTWVELDVTSGVTTGGLVSFGMSNTSTDSAYFSSKEGSNPPELVVTTGSSGNQSPVAADDTTTATSEQATVMTVLANDSDPDGDTLTITAVFTPAHGTATHNGTTVTYTSATGYTGADSFTYTISDGNSGTDTATVNVTVQSGGGGNQSPTATDDTATATSEQATVMTVLTNDSDPDGDTLTITAVSNPAHGTATHNGTTVTYTSATGYTGADSFTYTISDGNGGTDTATVNVTVQSGGGTATTTLNPSGDTHVKDSSPTTNYSTESTFRNRAGSPEYRGHLQFDLSALSGSVQQATLRLYVTSGSSEGGDVYLVSNNYADGSGPWTEGGLIYNNAPALGSNLLGSLGVVSSGTWVELDVTSGVTTGGLVSFGMNPLTSSSVYFSSKEGSNPPQLVVATGSGGNQSPVAADDTTTATSEQATVMTVLANDSDPDGDPLTITAVSNPAHGTATHNGTTVTYTSTTGYTGADSFTYTISDGNGGTDTATVNVTVQSGGGGNQTPTATDDTATATSEQATVMTVLANDSDPDGDPLTITAVSNPAHGTATHNGTTVTYTSATGYTGADSFTYTISDGNGGTDTATVNVTVQSGGGTTTTTLNPAQDSHISSSSPTSTSGGSASTIRNRAGSPEYRVYLQFDLSSLSGSVQQATLQLYVTDGSDDGGDVYVVSNNYADGSGPWTENGLTYSNAPALGATPLDALGVVSNGTWVELDVTSGVTTGGLVSFGMSNSSTNSVYFYSKEGSNPPELVVTTAAAPTIVAQDDSAATTAGNPAQLSVLDNDTYPVGTPVTITITTAAIYGSVIVNGDHTITYTPVGNCLNGDDSFVYTLSDSAGNSDTATVTVTVTDSSAQAATTPVPTPDWQVEGAHGCARLGYSVALAGDVNGDGYDDVIVGSGRFTYAPGLGLDEPYFQTGFGSADLYLGSTTGLTTTPAWTVVDTQLESWFGWKVNGVGDVNGDGYDDVVVSARKYQVDGIIRGRVYVYYGSSTGLQTNADWIMDGEQDNSRFGHDIAAAGDVDGDGYDDILVSDNRYDVDGIPDAGKVYLFYGSATGLATRQNTPWVAYGEGSDDWFGYSIRRAGYLNELSTDINRYSDIVIGEYHVGSGDGGVSVYYGGANGPGNEADWTYEHSQGGTNLGTGMPAVDTAGDVNGDGYDDVIVGARLYQQTLSNEGRVDLFYGSSSGLAAVPAWTGYGGQESAAFGWSVAGTGDVNNDGYGDVLIGADQYDIANTNEGKAYLFLGSSQGPSDIPSWVASGTQYDARFGHTVGRAGDVDGDGWLDILIGQQQYDSGALIDRGRAVAYYAVGSGLTVSVQARDDSVTTTDDVAATVPVLANDVYGGNPTVTIDTPPSSGTATVNGDNSITYTPTLGVTGVVSLTYRLNEGAASDTAIVTITVEAGSALIVTNTADSGAGSLRQAILDANSLPDLQTIRFNIPTSDAGYDAVTGAFTIQPSTQLPTITDPVIIDGSSQPGASCDPFQPLIEIDGSLTSGAKGLYIAAGNSTIKGLIINWFEASIFLETGGNNVVQCNFLGTDVTGTVGLTNSSGLYVGIWMTNTNSNLIGGANPGEGNLISGFSTALYMFQSHNNIVQGSYFGTDVTGSAQIPNRLRGIYLRTSTGNLIGGNTGTTPGGACTGACNILSSANEGIGLLDGADNNQIKGNFIGTDRSGQVSFANRDAGIYISWSNYNVVGGATPSERNVVSGNGGLFFGAITVDTYVYSAWGSPHQAVGNQIVGNYIGTDSSGQLALPNGGDAGVLIASHGATTIGASDNVISNNRIAFNNSHGIVVQNNSSPFSSIASTGNRIENNEIFANENLGIDLGYDGVTNNDSLDTDNGANHLQNYPVLTYAVPGASETTVAGVLQTAANGSYTVELFNNSSCNSSGYGEGETFLQAVAVTTDAEGNGTFTTTVAQALALGQFVTATATDASGNTSEFSACVTVSDTVAVNAIDDAATTDNDVAVTVPVLANDSYGSSPTVAIESAPSSGTAVVNGDNTVTYTPQLGSGGVVTFTYSLSEGGVSDTALVTVTVVPPAAADFVGNPTAGAAPLTVVFSDDSTGNPTAWFWQFGDGTVSTEQDPTHVYTELGSYTVTLTVNNDGGTMSVTKVDYITVTLGAPVANFSTTPISGTVPLTVTLTDLSTGQPTSWAWEFGDGATATVQHPSHTYSAAGTYTVTLTVSNTLGSDTATGTVTVLNSVANTAKVVRRISYRFGGQVVATRVVAEDAQGQLIDNPAFTGLFYVHGDHLGSATALSYGQDRPTLQGTLVPDSVARFLPFGGYRGAKPQTNPAVSDRGFTGHKHNDDLGLVYMNARYFVPGIGRFASADTIIPDPMNPQGFNRYSYGYNNPVNLIDPSGHCPNRCFDQGGGGGYYSDYYGWQKGDKTYDKYNAFDERLRPSAHAIGISFSAETPSMIGSWEVNVAFELVWDDDEAMLFVAPGGDFSRGYSNNAADMVDKNDPSQVLNRAFYVAQIHNTENLAEDYSGWFDVNSVTVAAGHGFVVADAFTPGDGETTPIMRERPYSIIFGYAPGISATYNEGRNFYIPIVPLEGGPYPPFPANHYLPMDNKGQSYTYPH